MHLNRKDVLKFIYKHTGGYRKLYFIYFILYVGSNIKNMYLPSYAYKQISDGLINNTFNFNNCMFYLVLYLLGFSILYLCMGCSKKIEYGLQVKNTLEIQQRLFKNILNKDMDFLNNNLSGALSGKIISTVREMSKVFNAICDICANGIVFVIQVIIFAFMSKTLFFASVILLIIAYFVFNLTLKNIKKYKAMIAEEKSRANGIVADCFSNISNVKIFVSNNKEQRRVKKQSINITRMRRKLQKARNVSYFLNYVFFSFYMFTIIFLSYDLYAKGNITFGTFLFNTAVAGRIGHWIKWTFKFIQKLEEEFATITNNLQKLLTPTKVFDKVNAKKIEVNTGRITYNNISFSYEKRK